MAYLTKTLSVSISLVLLVAFAGCQDKKRLWDDVAAFFNKENLSNDEIEKRVSQEAINSIVGGDTVNTKTKVKDFFKELGKQKKYSFDENNGLLYVTFNKSDKVVPGPSIEIKAEGENWYITDVRFGK